jgi:biotin carboxylase
MRRALDEFVVEGIKTNLPLHRRIFRDPLFMEGRHDTSYLDSHLLKK